MVYRAVVSFIWIFWLVMVTLLIRSEYFDQTASFYRLPIRYAAGKLFQTDTGSELSIYYKQTLVGKLRLEASPEKQRVLNGNVRLDWPVLGRIVHNELHFSFDFDKGLDVRKFGLSSQGEGMTFRASGSRAENRIEGNLESDMGAWKRSLSWSELRSANLERLLADSSLKDRIHLPSGLLLESGRQMSWYAASATLKADGKSFDALLIASEGNRDYWVKIWLTPSGEVILVETSPTIGLSMENKALLEINS